MTLARSTVLVADSTSYLTPEQASELGVVVVSLHVVLDGVSHAESDLAPAEFYRRLTGGGTPPTTSQPSPGEFLAAFDAAAAAGGGRVLCLTCSAAMSGTHRSAVLAAGMTELPVDVVDTGTISGGLHLLVGEVAQALADGTEADDARGFAQELAGRVRSSWSADTTALLTAGGRLAHDVPDGLPVMALDPDVRVVGTARSAREAVELQAEVIRAAAAASPTRVAVGHGDVADLADALAASVQDAPGVLGVDRYVVGPVVGAHSGPGTVGAAWLAGPA